MTTSQGCFNLISDEWIPVRRRSGATGWIAPWQITEDVTGDSVVAIAAPRPDFAAALGEFLIGLLATCAAPENEEAWLGWWAAPPAPEVLKARFDSFSYAFDLDGRGPRFLQDFEDIDGNEFPASALLIDAPGAMTERRNADLFVKRTGPFGLSRAAAAMALFTLQTYAPAGGAGNRTSLRGGGPLTTLAVGGEVLWQRLWPNVPTGEQIRDMTGNASLAEPAAIFPWLAPTQVSGRAGRPVTPDDAHPLQMFWGMPRRIRLDFVAGEGASCAMTGVADEVMVPSFRMKPHGCDYGEGWEHPLSPHYRQRDTGPWLPVHGQPGGVSYRHWLGLVQDVGGKRRAAPAIRHVRERRWRAIPDVRVHACGYDMDNMKARGWIESEMPIHALADAAAREAVLATAPRLIEAADLVARAAVGAIKRALFDRPGDVRGDFAPISDRFWRETEDHFFAVLDRVAELAAAPDDGADAAWEATARAWLAILRDEALALFDAYAPADGIEFAAAARLVRARYGLVSAFAGHGRQGAAIFKALDLAVPSRAAKTSVNEEAPT